MGVVESVCLGQTAWEERNHPYWSQHRYWGRGKINWPARPSINPVARFCITSVLYTRLKNNSGKHLAWTSWSRGQGKCMHYGPMLIDILIRFHSLLVVFQSCQESSRHIHCSTHNVRHIPGTWNMSKTRTVKIFITYFEYDKRSWMKTRGRNARVFT